MKHNDTFYESLKKSKEIFHCVVRCCQSDELNVRKVNLNFRLASKLAILFKN